MFGSFTTSLFISCHDHLLNTLYASLPKIASQTDFLNDTNKDLSQPLVSFSNGLFHIQVCTTKFSTLSLVASAIKVLPSFQNLVFKIVCSFLNHFCIVATHFPILPILFNAVKAGPQRYQVAALNAI
ncbi:hypothetical protein IKI14_00865 [bacterium]|nr:hypothetical protein [bacterium]